jgi:hypothetical protein
VLPAFNLRLLIVGMGAIVLVAAVLVIVRGLFLSGNKGVDRIVTLAQSRNGGTTLVLMHSDGSGKVTLADEPGASSDTSQRQSFPNGFIFAYAGKDDDELSIMHFGESAGATVLIQQQRILFWYPTADGMEIRSANMDGGDIVQMAHAAPVTRMIASANGDKVLLVEQDTSTSNNTGNDASSRLLLVSLRGQTTTLVQNILGVVGTISPDGKHVAYWQHDDSDRYKLTVVDDSGKNPVEVARDLRSASANFSSDSSKLFIVRGDDNGASFLVANADGQNPVVLSRNVESGRGEVAHDHLVYEARANGATALFTSDLNGDNRVEIVRGADQLEWKLMPDRQHIILTQQRSGRYALQISDFKHEQVQDLKRSDGLMFWRNLDNERVLVISYSDDNGGRTATISTIKQDGSDEQVLKRDLQLNGIAAQGDTIVLGGQANDHGALYLFGGKEPVLLDDEADGYGLVRIAPDGRILYTASFKSGPVTYSIDRSGKQKKLLSEDAVIVAAGF